MSYVCIYMYMYIYVFLDRLFTRCCRAAGFSLQPGHYSSLPAPNLQPTAKEERNDQCGNQHYSRELLMMGIVMPETF